MALTVGSRLGHYDVTALIGEGGMGQVYQATDTKLNRQVALKILPEAFATDPDRLARFQREAQVLASLNHPGIAAIYGIEEQDDTRALVLEFVEGPTLADRIAQGPLPVDEALLIARQIAEALEAAHQAGVIHRDLKPANIKVREDGTVKVLDFGLAKALDVAQEGDPNQSPTHTAVETEMGVIMGTAAYMSPEQARGKRVDTRADIWAFGVVVYETLTGRRAFEGADGVVTLANVIRAEPSWDSLPDTLPAAFAAYLRRCLHKDPSQRVSDIGDVRLAMEGAFDTAVASAVVPQRHVWQRALPTLSAMLLVALVTGLVVWALTRPGPPGVVRFTMARDVTPSLHIAPASQDVAISPNGQLVAYLSGSVGIGAERLHVRSVDQLTSETLVTEGEMNGPFFSPDGVSVGFYNRLLDNTILLQRVSVEGGPTSTICEIPSHLRGASWGADGTIVFATQDASGLWRVSAVGGAISHGQRNNSASFSDGFIQPRVCRGRSLSTCATRFRCRWLWTDKSVPLGKY